MVVMGLREQWRRLTGRVEIDDAYFGGEVQGHAELTVAAVFSSPGRGQWTYSADEGPMFRAAIDKAIAISRAPHQQEVALP